MPVLSASHAPGAFGEYVWATADDEVEVTPEEAQALLAIPDAGFTEVLPKATAKPKGRAKVTEPDPDAD